MHRARRIPVQPRYTSVRRHHGGVTQLVVLFVVAVGFAIGGTAAGADKQHLRHSASSATVLATVQRTTESCGRSCSYDSYVSFDIGSRHYVNVDVDDDVDDDEQRPVGTTVALFVNPQDASDNVLTSDHGWADFVTGGLGLLAAIVIGVLLVNHRRHGRAHRLNGWT